MTYAKLNGGGEEVNTGGLSNGVTAGNTGQVDESRLNNTLGALGGLDNSLGKTSPSQFSVGLGLSSGEHTGNRQRPWKGWRNQHRPWP